MNFKFIPLSSAILGFLDAAKLSLNSYEGKLGKSFNPFETVIIPQTSSSFLVEVESFPTKIEAAKLKLMLSVARELAPSMSIIEFSGLIKVAVKEGEDDYDVGHRTYFQLHGFGWLGAICVKWLTSASEGVYMYFIPNVTPDGSPSPRYFVEIIYNNQP